MRIIDEWIVFNRDGIAFKASGFGWLRYDMDKGKSEFVSELPHFVIEALSNYASKNKTNTDVSGIWLTKIG